jgi:hypothetical protein
MTAQSLIANVPENSSILQPTKYTFVIPDLPFARYFCQNVNLPGVSTSAVTVPTPFSETFRHGDKLVYEEFSISAIVDEDLRVWEETYNWIVSMTFPDNSSQYKRRIGSQTNNIYYDGLLTINTNANNPNIRVNFFNCHPVTLSSIQFSTSENAQTIPTLDITFRYDRFQIQRV